MEFLPFGDVCPAGILGERLLLSAKRMSEEQYEPQNLFFKNPEWPGDWEGRALLADIMLEKATGQKTGHFDGILEGFTRHMNENGYMGDMPEPGTISEQLLAGNSWVLRALCEIYEYRREPQILGMIEAMSAGLLTGMEYTYEVYPISRAQRDIGQGAEAGNLTGKVSDGWLSSTDIGCAFIMLDGASHAYRILKDPALYRLLHKMTARFRQADLMDATFQTHATLSAARGILRFYEDTKEAELLTFARDLFEYYLKNGMTENYGNYNWFGRPEWTEPCAIVDSYLVAAELWRITREIRYLDLAHSIFYNGLLFAQRKNGGFGCDVCTGAGTEFLAPVSADSYEAWWCCTMRGGDGLANAARHMAARDGEVLALPFYNSGLIRSKGLTLAEESRFPFGSSVSFRVIRLEQPLRLAFYIPSCAAGFCLKINGRQAQASVSGGFAYLQAPVSEGDFIELQFDLSPILVPAFSPQYQNRHTLRYGFLELGAEAPDAPLSVTDSSGFTSAGDGVFTDAQGHVWKPLSNIAVDKSKEDLLAARLQVIF